MITQSITFIATILLALACGWRAAKHRFEPANLTLTDTVGNRIVTTTYTGPALDCGSMVEIHRAALKLPREL